MASPTYYERLALEPDAGPEEIATAIRSARRTWAKRASNPDLETRQKAERELAALGEIERVLGNPEAKAEYDRSIAPFAAPPSPRLDPPRISAPTAPAPDASPEPSPEPTSPAAAPEPSEQRATPPWLPTAFEGPWNWGRQHPLGAGGAALVLVLLIAIGFSAVGNRASPEQTFADTNEGGASAAGTAATSDVSNTPPSETPSPTPTDQSLTLGDSSGTPFSMSNGRLSVQGPVILPATSSPIDTGTLFPNEQIRDSSFDIVGSAPNEEYVGLVEVFHPANGLTPQSYERRFVDLGPSGTTIAASTTISSSGNEDDEKAGSVWGTAGGQIVMSAQKTSSSGESTDYTEAVDTHGALLWRVAGLLQTVVADVPIIERDYSAKDPNGNPTDCQDVDALDPSNGTVTWAVRGTAGLASGNSCQVSVDPNQSLNNGASSVPTQRYVPLSGGAIPDSGEVVQVKTGAALRWRSGDHATSGLVDPVTGDVYSGWNQADSGANEPAELYDPRSGRVLWSMSYAKANALDFQVQYVYGGKLYATTTSENLVLDTASGDTGASWQDDADPGVPVAEVDGYTVATTGSLTPDAAAG